MTPEQNKKTVRQFFAAYDREDYEACMACLHPDFKAVLSGQPPVPNSGVYRQLGEMFKAAFPDSVHKIISQVAEGDRVVTVSAYMGTQTGPMPGIPITGKKVNLNSVICDTFRDGKIVLREAVWDNLQMMQQLGLVPQQQTV